MCLILNKSKRAATSVKNTPQNTYKGHLLHEHSLSNRHFYSFLDLNNPRFASVIWFCLQVTFSTTLSHSFVFFPCVGVARISLKLILIL